MTSYIGRFSLCKGLLARMGRNLLFKSNVFGLLLIFLVLTSLFIWQGKAEADTSVSGSINQDTTWAIYDSPYTVTSSITLFPGFTLTIEPGVEVIFSSGVRLNIRGTLIAEGTEINPIIFRSSAIGSKGSWNGIYLDTNLGANASIKYVSITDAQSAISVTCCGNGGPVNISDSTFSNNVTALGGYAGWDMIIERCIFEDNTYAVTAADKEIHDSIFRNNDYGLYQTERVSVYSSVFTGHQIALYGGRGEVTNCEISENDIGVQANYGGFTLTNNTITNNTEGVILGQYDTYSAPVEYNNIYDNTNYNLKNTGSSDKNVPNNWWGTTEECEIEEQIYDGCDDASVGIVYYSPVLTGPFDTTPSSVDVNRCPTCGTGVVSDTTWTVADSPYTVTSSITLFPGFTLTIEPGVEVIFSSGVRLNIRGTLIAEGTEINPIIFRSSAIGSKGSWNGIYLDTNLGANASIKYVSITDAQSAISVTCCGNGGPVNISDSTFSNNVTALGGYAGWDMIIERCIFEDNTYAVTAADKEIHDSIFRNNDYGLYQTERVSVYSSVFTGHQIALYGGRGEVTNCEISENDIGVQANYGGFTLTNNTITNNTEGVILGQYDTYSAPVEYNNIYDNTNYNLKNTGSSDKNVPNNWWGTTNLNDIGLKIFDGNDDSNLGIVYFEPILNEPITFQTDSDGDGVPNNDDNCPTVANPDQADLDGDNIGNLCDDDIDGDGTPNDTDTDDDNDGMPDEWENQYSGLNPYLNDANGDLDGDGLTNLQEYQGGSDPAVPDSVSNQSPVIDSFTANLSDTWIVVETGEEIIFNCNAHDPDGEIYGYTIDFGDGSTPLTNQRPNQTGVMSYGYSEAGKYQVTCAVVDNNGNTTISQAITVTATDPSHDITIKIQNENGEPLNGYLLFRDSPPKLNPVDFLDLLDDPDELNNFVRSIMEEYYDYFRDFETDENGILNGYNKSYRINTPGIGLKAVYVRNGLVLLHQSDIINSDDNIIESDKLTHLFFFETEQQNDPYMSDKMISERISFAENVCWWTLNINSAEIESRNLSQIVTVMGKNSWTETLDNTLQNDGYFENHTEKMCFVLEPPLSCLNNQIKSSSTNLERPLILVHGINGMANYWEEDTPIPNKLRSEGSLLWEFYYRGQDKISDCADMLKKAIDIVSIMNSPTCDKVDIVTHSYGGVITRYYLSRNFLHPISNLLMIAPPHHGSYSAYQIYLEKSKYIIQRQGLFNNEYLDFFAPIYEELIPGSSSLMSMEVEGPNVFSLIENTLILAGKKPIIILGSGFLHKEAPDHDDGLVSISSASLLDYGVDLGIINLNHREQNKDSRIVDIIKDFLYDGSVGTVDYGSDKNVELVIQPGSDISQYDSWRSNSAGIIIETSSDVQSVQLSHIRSADESSFYRLAGDSKDYTYDLEGPFDTTAQSRTFFFYDGETIFEWYSQPSGTAGSTPPVFLKSVKAGLAYPFEQHENQEVRLKYFFSDGTEKFLSLTLKPTRTEVVRRDIELFDDSDGDGLFDDVEFSSGTNPFDADTDDDGLVDGNTGSEDLNANGIVDQGETDPRATDTDGDGIMDGTEKGLTEPETDDTNISAGFFVADADPSTTTDPTDADTDDDGILDGNEDKNHDGLIDTFTGETDPGNPDSDGDGIYDGTEIGLTEPQDPDATDISAGVFVADADPSTTTDPTNPDSDGDGTTDGEEDKNRDGAYNPDEGETDPTVIEVTIDIKPGSDPNCFNNDGHGVIPLAILGSADFDCTQIDPSTCTLSGLTLKIAGKSNKLMASIEDVNNDGFDDLVLQIEDQDGAFQVGESEATLTGNLYEAYGGTPIQGTDSICIVP